jgi:hypothetical protein
MNGFSEEEKLSVDSLSVRSTESSKSVNVNGYGRIETTPMGSSSLHCKAKRNKK